MWKLLVAVLVAVTIIGMKPVPSADAGGAPALEVSVFPFRGVIPAKFANGRAVYMFQASMKDVGGSETVVVLHDQALLQSGMSEELHSKNDDRELRAVIWIDPSGTARYRATVSARDRTLVAASAHVAVGPDAGVRGFDR